MLHAHVSHVFKSSVTPTEAGCPASVWVCSQSVHLATNCEQSCFERAATVLQVKKGPLAETSPMLNDISGVPGWSKVRILRCVGRGTAVAYDTRMTDVHEV